MSDTTHINTTNEDLHPSINDIDEKGDNFYVSGIVISVSTMVLGFVMALIALLVVKSIPSLLFGISSFIIFFIGVGLFISMLNSKKPMTWILLIIPIFWVVMSILFIVFQIILK